MLCDGEIMNIDILNVNVLIYRLRNTHNEVASEEIPLSLTEAENLLKEHEDIKVSC